MYIYIYVYIYVCIYIYIHITLHHALNLPIPWFEKIDEKHVLALTVMHIQHHPSRRPLNSLAALKVLLKNITKQKFLKAKMVWNSDHSRNEELEMPNSEPMNILNRCIWLYIL